MSLSTFVRRVVLGAPDPEMAAILTLLGTLDIPVVCAIPGAPDDWRTDYAPGAVPRPWAREAGRTAYRSDIEPEAGDVWIECAPTEGPSSRSPTGRCGGKAGILAAGGTVIDHHFPGDPGFGVLRYVDVGAGHPALCTSAFEASSIGQLVALLAAAGRLPWPTLGMDTPAEDAIPGALWRLGSGWAVTVPSNEGCALFAVVPSSLVMSGEADHSLAAFVRGACSTPEADACAWLVARLPEATRDILREARDALHAAPRVIACYVPDGHGDTELRTVADLRGFPSLAPGGRLGDALVPAAMLAGAAYVGWGAQGVTAQGRHLGFGGGGEGSAIGVYDFRPMLADLGCVGVYGDPARGVGGGYVPVA